MLKSELRVRIVGAANPLLLEKLSNAAVMIEGLNGIDELTAEFRVPVSDKHSLLMLAKKTGTQVEILGGNGIGDLAGKCIRRPLLLAGILVLLILTILLPTRVYFFRVEGNVSVPTKAILEKAADCGISFGASRRDIRSERMKNALLEAMPELQWAGINTKGCVAVISVRERDRQQTREEQGGVSGIFAVTDALVESVTVTSGTAACQPGTTVQAGQLLISGYTDAGLVIRGDRAGGEVFGRTQRSLTVIAPLEWTQKLEVTATERRYSLLLGKKQINFSKGSGISGGSCDRMYEENYMILPGGFSMPIGIGVETWIYYTLASPEPSQEDAGALLSACAQGYVQQQMLAGQILSGKERISRESGALVLTGEYSCREMIGRERKEEIITPYGKYDGTDR